MGKIELLAPAGSIDKLKIALLYGADAVYFGGRNYSLRANAKNLGLSEIKEACEYAHSLGILVVVDAAQSIGHIKIDVEKCNISFLAFTISF